MPTDHRRAKKFLDRLFQDHNLDDLRERLKPKHHNPSGSRPRAFRASLDGFDQRRKVLDSRAETRAALVDLEALRHLLTFQCNIENFIATVKLPVGLAEYTMQDQIRGFAYARATHAGDRGQP